MRQSSRERRWPGAADLRAMQARRRAAWRRRSHVPSGPGGSPTAGPDVRSMSVPAWMSLAFGALLLLAKRQCSPKRASDVTRQAGLHLGCRRSCAMCLGDLKLKLEREVPSPRCSAAYWEMRGDPLAGHFRLARR